MTAFALKPTFIDKKGYQLWRRIWSETYRRLSQDIVKRKLQVKDYQRDFNHYMDLLQNNQGDLVTPKVQQAATKLAGLQYELVHFRSVAHKMMTLLKEAEARRDRILKMHADVKAQPFPLDLPNCDRVDFHFNRGHNEFPFLPMWVVRAKGQSYYVNEVQANVPWTTHERQNGSTKGVLRFPRCSVHINAEGIAKIS